MTIQLHRLEGFYWVAREEGYSAAARAFPYPITQPGVHRQVKALEDDLGTKLFERVGHRKMRLTPAGETLYAFCAPFFERLPGVVEDVRDTKPRLRIDAGELELSYAMPAWIRALREAEPELSLELYEFEGAKVDRLRAGAVELVVNHFDRVPEDCESQRIGTHYVFLAHTEQRKLSFTDAAQLLTTRPFVAFSEGSNERRLVMSALKEANFKVKTVAAASSVTGLLSLVRAGFGVSLIPWPQPEGPQVDGVYCFPVPPAVASFSIDALWLKRRSSHSMIQRALELAPAVR